MNEQEASPENNGTEIEPSPQDLAEACIEVLSEDDCQELASMELEDGIGYAFTLLLEAGEDPDTFLKEKGILQ